MKTILFPGWFDPFTIGHENLIKRILPVFDRVVVAVGVNSDKQYMFSVKERMERISKFFSFEPKVKVICFSDMTVDCCHREGASYILRGVRNSKDMEYEQVVAAVNHKLDNSIETILLFADPELVDVSSTLERERLLHEKNS